MIENDRKTHFSRNSLLIWSCWPCRKNFFRRCSCFEMRNATPKSGGHSIWERMLGDIQKELVWSWAKLLYWLFKWLPRPFLHGQFHAKEPTVSGLWILFVFQSLLQVLWVNYSSLRKNSMVSDLRKNWCKALQKMTGSASFKYQAIHSEVLLREEILHHRGCKEPCK